jgi:hypothetical protein
MIDILLNAVENYDNLTITITEERSVETTRTRTARTTTRLQKTSTTISWPYKKNIK